MILSGIFAMKCDEKVRILEIKSTKRNDSSDKEIENNDEKDEENVRELKIIIVDDKDTEIIYEHTFLISYLRTWYCFYECFWYKKDEEERMDLRDIRKFIEDNNDKIHYELIYSHMMSIYLNRYLTNFQISI